MSKRSRKNKKVNKAPISYRVDKELIEALDEVIDDWIRTSEKLRDLKPDNIIVFKDGIVKLGDFDQMKPVEQELPTLDEGIEYSTPPRLAEQALLLILSKEERLNLIGDLAEEYGEIQFKHGITFAQIWYWKQVASSAWPIIWKGIRWGLLTWVGEWVRRRI